MSDERVLDLVRLRLLVRGKQPAAKLAASLQPYVDESERWRERWEAALERLAEGGELDRPTSTLTDRGRARALSCVGLAELPARASFLNLVRRYLVPRALGVADDRGKRRLATADGLRAAALSEGGAPTLQQAIDRKVWRALGLPDDGPLTLKKLRERVLAREVGNGRPVPLDRAVRIAAAAAVGARRTEPDALAEAIVRRWVSASEPTAPAEPSLDALARFASDVLALARDPGTRRFTNEKAFIESVWHRASADRPMELGDFKERLLEAHRRGLLVLSRADMSQLIPPTELAASEIEVDGAAFHFVRTDLPEVTP